MQVVDDGRVVALRAGRQTRLLSCLLLCAGDVVSRDRLIDALWGERPPASAGNALQVLVHRLRKLLGEDRIATDGPGYRLRVGPSEVDLEKFEGLVVRGRSELAAGDAEAASVTLRAALSLWRGPALADVAYEPFAQGEIVRLEELRLVALEERVEADLAVARHEELVPELESLVSAHRTRERLHGQLMLALYRCGRQTDALAVYRRARQALRDELGLEPGSGLQLLQQAILRHDRSLHVESPELRHRRHLPAPATPLVGRRREVEDVAAMLRTEAVRLVTLTGTAGSGKTRLALQIAHDLADAFPDGVHFVDLSSLRDARLVAGTIGQVLGLAERSDGPAADALEDFLRARSLLLVLDNFEVVDEAAPLLGELLKVAPDLALLVTSRVALRLSGEHDYRVSPLPLADAVRLFAERARAVSPGFRRPSEEAEEVAEICRRLDCLPLAIELAASRIRDYSAQELLGMLRGSLDLPGAAPRDLPERQRTMQDAIGWSYERLPAEEQVLLARVAVFAGGCTATAAETVCGAGRVALASLVGKSLLVERVGGDGELRFRMLETIREFALERLDESGETSRIKRLHADFVLALAEEAGPMLRGADQTRWLARLESERENIRAALRFGLDSGTPELTLELAVALEFWWWTRSASEGLAWLERGLDADSLAPGLRAAGLEVAGAACWFVGDHERALRLFEEALAVYRQLLDRAGEARILNRLGPPLGVVGRHDEAEQLVKSALELNRELGVDAEVVLSLHILGVAAYGQGRVAESVALLEECAHRSREIGDLQTLGVALVNLAEAALTLGEPARAGELGREALTLAGRLGAEITLLHGLSIVAIAEAREGDTWRAGVLWGAAERLADELGPTTWDREHPQYARMLGEPPSGFEEGRLEGLTTTVAVAVDIAVDTNVRAEPDAVLDRPQR